MAIFHCYVSSPEGRGWDSCNGENDEEPLDFGFTQLESQWFSNDSCLQITIRTYLNLLKAFRDGH